MKETPLSTSERTFIIDSISKNLRLDGRRNNEFRNLKINFGLDYGSVIVSLGETKVLAVVTCDLGEPKATRPNEGMIYINIELGSIAAPNFETGRNSDLTVQINRILERTFKDSRCVDLESLCVTAEEHVWILRVDLHALNHDGNLIDCCSIATLCALASFRRPDVSVIDNEFHVHTPDEKEPIAIVLHHYPVCVSYVTFCDGKIATADPTYAEERTAESEMIFGLNSFRELCCLNVGGKSLTNANLLIKCAHFAAERAKHTVNIVKKALEEEKHLREIGAKTGYMECVRLQKITSFAEDRLALKLRDFKFFPNNLMAIEEASDVIVREEIPEEEHNANLENRFEQHANIDEDTEDDLQWIPKYNGDDDDDENDDNNLNFNLIKDGVDNDGNDNNDDDDDDDDDDEDDDNLAEEVEMALKRTNQREKQPISKQKRFEGKF